MPTSLKSLSMDHGMSSGYPQYFLFVFGIFHIILATVDALQCFQCVSTASDGGDCFNNRLGLLNATRIVQKLNAIDTTSLTKEGKREKENLEKERDRNKYLKDCTATKLEFTRCYIEYHLGPEDKFIFFTRGCHDGVTFNTKVHSERFIGLEPNNETTCAFPEKLVNTGVCFQFCDTDLCNGPQPTPDPCEGYNSSDPNATMPEGVFCGAKNLHSNIVLNTLICLVTSFLCMHFITTLK